MKRLGLTGGIGSGKSTVAVLLAQHGAAIIDADAIARQVTAPGGQAIAAIQETFGPGFVAPDGAMDRDAMRSLAFTDASAKSRLENIVHPLVGAEIERQTAAARAAGCAVAVLDIPLLVESGRWSARLDQVLVIDCGEPTQIARVTARSGLSREAVQGIIAQQATRAARLAVADVVICNDGISVEQLRNEVWQVARRFGL